MTNENVLMIGFQGLGGISGVIRADGATFAVPRARTFAGDGGGPVELHGMTGCRCSSGVRSSRRDANGWPTARGHGRRCACRRVRSPRLAACAGRGRVHRADGHGWHGRARRAPGAGRGRFRWRAKSSRHDRRGRGAVVRLVPRARTFAGDGGGRRGAARRRVCFCGRHFLRGK